MFTVSTPISEISYVYNPCLEELDTVQLLWYLLSLVQQFVNKSFNNYCVIMVLLIPDELKSTDNAHEMNHYKPR